MDRLPDPIVRIIMNMARFQSWALGVSARKYFEIYRAEIIEKLGKRTMLTFRDGHGWPVIVFKNSKYPGENLKIWFNDYFRGFCHNLREAKKHWKIMTKVRKTKFRSIYLEESGQEYQFEVIRGLPILFYSGPGRADEQIARFNEKYFENTEYGHYFRGLLTGPEIAPGNRR